MLTPKILLCNVPIRDEAGPFPPVACTSLCNFLRKAGYDTSFYDIDAKRPSFVDLAAFFGAHHFDAVGISAVVSTSYRYVKDLAALIKKCSPDTQVILGGNLAVAYEVILRKCSVDVCVMGEGEKPLLGLVKYLEKYGRFDPPRKELYEIKGISFPESGGECKFTGPEKPLGSDEIEQPDYDLLKECGEYSDIDKYILDPMTRYDFKADPRSCLPHRQGRKMAIAVTAKGCINRCSFCHRWIGGYRVIPAGKVVDAMKYLKDKHNIGFFVFGDECFSEDKRWLEEFITLVKPLDVLFIIGARVSLVKNNPEVIGRLKDAGLTAVYFGMESGSKKMLRVMEKNATREDNLKALNICKDAGIFTVIQLVVGMPGENDRTIDETVDFLKSATEDMPHTPVFSLNWIQALPGTPCYDFLRYHNLLGKTMDDEEEYLLNISNVNAGEFSQYINASEEPLSRVKVWSARIDVSVKMHWLKRHGWKFRDNPYESRPYKNTRRGIVSRIKDSIRSAPVTYMAIDRAGKVFWKIILFRKRCSVYGITKSVLVTFGLSKEEDRTPFKIETDSLRNILKKKQALHTDGK